MDFICCVSVPDDELTVLRGGYEVSTVIGPVHGVDFGQVTPECPPWAHYDSWKRVDLSGHSANCRNGEKKSVFWKEGDEE